MSIQYNQKLFFNIREYGATGSGDDTIPIQNAINAAANGVVFFPAGTYSVSGLTINASCNLKGEGATLVSSSTAPLITLLSSNVTIEGLDLDGNNLAFHGIFLNDGVENITILNNIIHDIYSTASTANGIIFSDGCNNIRISNNYIYNIYSINQTVPSRAIRGDGNTSPSTPIYGVLISNNIIDNVYNVSVSGAYDAEGVVVQGWTALSDINIVGNNIRRCAKRAIKVQTPGTNVTSNVLTMSSGVIDPYTAISLYSSNCIASNNRIYGVCTFAGIGIGGNSEGQIVSNNSIEFSPHSNASLDGVNTDGGFSNYSVISGNSIRGTHRSGIRLSHSCQGVSIMGNISKGASASAYIMTASGVSCSYVGNVGISHAHYLLHDNNIGTTSKCVAAGNTNDGGGFGVVSATFLADMQAVATGNGTTSILTGAGSPESSLTAGVGSIYLRSGGGTSSTFYVKETGTGNTGWIAK